MAYCDSEEEREKNPDVYRWFAAIANGDQDAENFLRAMWSFLHLYDDLVDRDRPVSIAQAAAELANLFTTLLYNPFFARSKDALFPLMISMINRWVDGDEWEQREGLFDQVASSVIRCGDVDLYLMVAFLTGGWEHMRRVRGARSYDTNEKLEALLRG